MKQKADCMSEKGGWNGVVVVMCLELVVVMVGAKVQRSTFRATD